MVDKPLPNVRYFNKGKSRTVLHFADISSMGEAYIVYREDGLLGPKKYRTQGNIKAYNSYDNAKQDYDKRINFIKEAGF
jgi:hypothetical protein